MKALKRIRVRNMESTKGNNVPNQFIITTEEGEVFQSYSTIIAFRRDDGKIFLDENAWDYSTTTGKYRNIFLRENKKETIKNIDNGTYTLTDLN